VALVRGGTQIVGAETVSGPLDSAPARAALAEADAIVHLAGALRPEGGRYHAANVATTRVVADAARQGRPTRVMFLSFPGARVTHPNAYLRTKAIAERVLVSTGKEVVIFRCTNIIGPPGNPGPMVAAMLAKKGGVARTLGTGTQRVRPVLVDDVAAALEAALQRGRPGEYDLAGPDEMSLDQLIGIVNRNPNVRIAHLPAWVARTIGPAVLDLPRPMVGMLVNDAVGDPASAMSEFGLTLTRVESVWR
jgi:nucleoside-diphosphate-sugar epimerase